MSRESMCVLIIGLLATTTVIAAAESDQAGQHAANQASGETLKPEAPVMYDVAYGADPLQCLDIHRTEAEQPAPVMIYAHGGGWRKGDKSRVGNKPAFFKKKGWVFVSIDYRLVPRNPFPANVSDVARAIDWVYRNISRYGGDRERIFIMGHSAGAHLVSLVATDPTYLNKYGRSLGDIKGVISLDTQAYDLVEMLADWSSPIYTTAFGDDRTVYQTASPLHQIRADGSIPPFLVCYSSGASPNRVSSKRATRAEAFFKKLRGAGVKADLLDASDRNHGEINQWFGLDSDTRVTGSAWRFLKSLTDIPKGLQWRPSLTFKADDGPVRPVNAMNLTAHKGKLFCGMATSMERERFSDKSSYVFVKESAESEWKLDADFGPRTSRVGAMQSVRFEFDSLGRTIPDGPVDILVAFTLHLGRDEHVLQARIRDDAAGKWLTVDLPTPRAVLANVRCMAMHRDRVSGVQYLFVGASPAPLGILKGVYDPEAAGGIRWLPEVEMVSTSTERRGAKGKWFGMASVDGKLFVSSYKRIFRRIDGPECQWVEVASFSRLDRIESAPPRGLTAVPVLKRLKEWPEREMLLFSAGGQMYRMRTPDDPEVEHTVEAELDIVKEVSKQADDLAVFAEGAFNRIRYCPERGGFWPIGFQVVFGEEGVKPRANDPTSYRLKPEAWYLRRDRSGAYSFARIADDGRTLFLIRDFEPSPFGDQTLYACGYNGSYFKGSLGTAWVFRGKPVTETSETGQDVTPAGGEKETTP